MQICIVCIGWLRIHVIGYWMCKSVTLKRPYTFKLLPSSFFLIQLSACCCGSMHSGNREARVVKIPFWMDSSSGGRFSDVHLKTKTVASSVVTKQNKTKIGASSVATKQKQTKQKQELHQWWPIKNKQNKNRSVISGDQAKTNKTKTGASSLRR